MLHLLGEAPTAVTMLALAFMPENKPKDLKACRKQAVRARARLETPLTAQIPESLRGAWLDQRNLALEKLTVRCRLCRLCPGR